MAIRSAAQPLVNRVVQALTIRANHGGRAFSGSGLPGTRSVITASGVQFAIRSALSSVARNALSGEFELVDGETARTLASAGLTRIMRQLNDQASPAQMLVPRYRASLNPSEAGQLRSLHSVVSAQLAAALPAAHAEMVRTVGSAITGLQTNFITLLTNEIALAFPDGRMYSALAFRDIVNALPTTGDPGSVRFIEQPTSWSLYGLYWTKLDFGTQIEEAGASELQDAIDHDLSISAEELTALRSAITAANTVYDAELERLKMEYCEVKCTGGRVKQPDGSCACAAGMVWDTETLMCVDDDETGVGGDCTACEESQANPLATPEFPDLPETICVPKQCPACSTCSEATGECSTVDTTCLIPGQEFDYGQCGCACPTGQTIIELEGVQVCGEGDGGTEDPECPQAELDALDCPPGQQAQCVDGEADCVVLCAGGQVWDAAASTCVDFCDHPANSEHPLCVTECDDAALAAHTCPPADDDCPGGYVARCVDGEPACECQTIPPCVCPAGFRSPGRDDEGNCLDCEAICGTCETWSNGRCNPPNTTCPSCQEWDSESCTCRPISGSIIATAVNQNGCAGVQLGDCFNPSTCTKIPPPPTCTGCGYPQYSAATNSWSCVDRCGAGTTCVEGQCLADAVVTPTTGGRVIRTCPVGWTLVQGACRPPAVIPCVGAELSLPIDLVRFVDLPEIPESRPCPGLP